MSNNNLELLIDDAGVIHLNHWDSHHGVDRIFQIRPDEQNAGEWVAYEEIYDPEEFNQVDLLLELSKMATEWRALSIEDGELYR